jgi:hypothetical protein
VLLPSVLFFMSWTPYYYLIDKSDVLSLCIESVRVCLLCCDGQTIARSKLEQVDRSSVIFA